MRVTWMAKLCDLCPCATMVKVGAQAFNQLFAWSRLDYLQAAMILLEYC